MLLTVPTVSNSDWTSSARELQFELGKLLNLGSVFGLSFSNVASSFCKEKQAEGEVIISKLNT